jgi:hypothetical protein
MPRKTVQEFLDRIERYPYAVSSVLGDGWLPGDVQYVAKELRVKLGLPPAQTAPGIGHYPQPTD